jgi:hypothetical protein
MSHGEFVLVSAAVPRYLPVTRPRQNYESATDDDVATLQQILALKFLGFRLKRFGLFRALNRRRFKRLRQGKNA